MEFSGTTTGTITQIKTLWWIKVKLKAVRMGPTDGVAFPHSAVIKYTVGSKNYSKKIYLSWRILPPPEGTRVTVNYDPKKPSRCKIGFYPADNTNI